MSTADAFADFLNGLFELFSQKTFGRVDYLTYVQQGRNRSGDEASIVDTAIVGPILGLLGFRPAERVYKTRNALRTTSVVISQHGKHRRFLWGRARDTRTPLSRLCNHWS